MRTDFPEPICTLLRKPFEISALTQALQSCTIDCDSEKIA
jgi:hypothetical protein